MLEDAEGSGSIVYDARGPDMKDIMNARVKNREPFRPFAPSVLAERTGDWFEQDHPSPFMAMTYKLRPAPRTAVEFPALSQPDEMVKRASAGRPQPR